VNLQVGAAHSAAVHFRHPDVRGANQVNGAVALSVPIHTRISIEPYFSPGIPVSHFSNAVPDHDTNFGG